MTTKVTKESLAKKIKALESRGSAEYALGLTLNEEYQLEAYRLLIDLMPKECQHKWRTIEYSHARELLQCSICGEMKEGQGNY